MRYHWCVRVYNNDERTVEVRSERELPEWLDYNKVARFGNALFVDGQCVANGYLSAERCQAWTEKLTIEFADITQDQLQRKARPAARTVRSIGHPDATGTAARMALMSSALVEIGASRLPQVPVQAPGKRAHPASTTINLGRNTACACGSGKKSKRCCGKT